MPRLLDIVLTDQIDTSVTPTLQTRDVPAGLALQASFVYGSGDASADVYVQISICGALWCDVAQFHFETTTARPIVNLTSTTPVTTQLTPTDGTLSANTAVDGILGTKFRLKYKSTGDYDPWAAATEDPEVAEVPATTLRIDAVCGRLMVPL